MISPIPELELEVLSSCLAFGEECYRDISTILEPRDFSEERNEIAWAMLQRMDDAGEIVDGELAASLAAMARNIHLCDILKGRSSESVFECLGGFTGISSISDRGFKHDLSSIAQKLREAAVDRHIAANMTWATQRAQERGSSAGDVLNALVARTDEMRLRSAGGTLADCETRDAPDYRSETSSWGIDKLDSICPLVPGHNIVIGARPGCGKSSLGYWLLMGSVWGGGDPSILSMELPRGEIRQEMIRRFNASDLELGKISVADGKHDGLQVGRQVKAWGTAGRRLAIIDYVQKVQVAPGRASGIFDRLDTACQEIQMAGRWHGVCTVTLAQLARGVDKAGNETEPSISDLKGCGTIEELADVVILPHHVPASGEVEGCPVVRLKLLIKKNRHGPQGAVWVEWDKAAGTFKPSRAWEKDDRPKLEPHDLIGQEPDNESEDLFNGP